MYSNDFFANSHGAYGLVVFKLYCFQIFLVPKISQVLHFVVGIFDQKGLIIIYWAIFRYLYLYYNYN